MGDPTLPREVVDDQTVNYVLRYGGMCRDCADQDGICPTSGLPCAGPEKAVRHMLKALRYGIENGFLPALAAVRVDLEPYDRIAALEAERRCIVSHATGGRTDGEGMSLNDVSVEITRFRNELIEDARTTLQSIGDENE